MSVMTTKDCDVNTTSARVVAHGAARVTSIVLGFCALAGAAHGADTTMPPEAARVTVVKPKNACFSAAVRVSGFLVPRVEGTLQIEPDGSRVTEVLVAQGDVVTAGQVMARLARPTFDVGGEQARRSPSAQGELATRAGANVAATAPSAAGASPSTTTIQAPFAGKVLESTARIGAVASPLGEPLFRIAAEGEIEAEVEIPSAHIPILAPGRAARVEVEDGRELSGHVRLVFVEINPITQLGRARISLDGDPSLVAGKFVRATIDARRSCGIAIPRSAISYRTEGTSVQVVRDGAIETRNVRVGLRSDLDAEIQEGLAEGDVVVANAGTSLRDGDTVTPIFRDKPE
jgi:multidrug efflux pump subunit AcrA (membrane-fusion protein)